MLKQYGFKVYKIRVTGHHPKRFFTKIEGHILLNLVLLFSKLFKLGDTFEVYCQKE